MGIFLEEEIEKKLRFTYISPQTKYEKIRPYPSFEAGTVKRMATCR